jgi:hypothetical protein
MNPSAVSATPTAIAWADRAKRSISTVCIRGLPVRQWGGVWGGVCAEVSRIAIGKIPHSEICSFRYASGTSCEEIGMRFSACLVASSLLALTACGGQRYAMPSYTPSFSDPVSDLRDRTAAEAQQQAEAARSAINARTLKPYTVSEAEKSVRAGLRDPESARFRDVRRNTATGAVCGVMNAKNAYGGYTGEAPFIYYYSTKEHGPQVLMGEQISATATAPYVAAFCP